jgi:tRNA-dihydrouridine synthase A
MFNSLKILNRKFCVAPMMERTDRHFRYLARLITRCAMLYTEMVAVPALIHGQAERALWFHPLERPLALQLGGSEPVELAAGSRMAQEAGYDEVNLNVGCPSPRVRDGRFGACLMAEPALVADCVAAMADACDLPVTVKTRLGIDDRGSYDELCDFVGRVAEAGCSAFIVHARKAWLRGLNPKQNRSVPPLRYDTVYRLKRDLPTLEIIVNGGITTVEAARAHLEHVDGAMLGREAYGNPWLLVDVDRQIYGAEDSPPTRGEVLARYLPYVEQQLANGVSLNLVTRHLMGFYQGLPGAKRWRRTLGEGARAGAARADLIREAAELVDDTARAGCA